MSSSIDLRIQRVWCSECHATNGLLPSILVPYSQIPLKDQQDILICAENHRPTTDVMSRNFLVDESNVRYILKQFRKHWKQRILSLALTLADELPIPCLSVYSMQFMQVRRTPNILFSPPT